jgi:hypothetical protein
MQRGEKVKLSSLSVSLTPFLVEEENKKEDPCKLQRKRETEVRNVDRMKKMGKGERKERKKSLVFLVFPCSVNAIPAHL